MSSVEHHIEVIDRSTGDAKPDVEFLAAHLRTFGDDGWELVSANLGVDLSRFGRSDVLVFKRVAAPRGPEASSA